MRCWFISDTHNRHAELRVPENVDIVFHCGDESNSGKAWLNELQARTFFTWYRALPIATKIFVPGNHSTAIAQGLLRPTDFADIHFLIHDQMNTAGLNVFGTPYTPEFFNWSYMKPREALDAVWQTIPDEVDILITHGPPKGILDVTKDMDTRKPIHVGSQSLTRHVTQRIKPLVHAFGHIHDELGIRNFGLVEQDGITFLNAACCNLEGRLVNHGWIVEIDAKSMTIKGCEA